MAELYYRALAHHIKRFNSCSKCILAWFFDIGKSLYWERCTTSIYLQYIRSIINKVKDGFLQIEAKKVHMVEVIAFLYVPQCLIPKERLDGKEEEHCNLIHLPMKIHI